MKTQLSVAAIAVLVLGASWTSPISPKKVSPVTSVKLSVPVPGFDFFRTHRQARGITATWGLNQNAGVSGFVVQKTYEDPYDEYANWENICSMPCGNGRSFKHHDETVSPGFISYRVIGYLQGGGTFTSSISTERIVGH